MATDQSQHTAFLQEPPIIEISNGVAIIRDRSGTGAERAMSIRNLERAHSRVKRALERYAAGETDIIVDD